MKKNWVNYSLQTSTENLSRKADLILRVIFDGKNSGFWNMAQDEALLSLGETIEQAVPPTLRLFSWAEPTLSIGRFQRTDSLNLSYLEKKKIPLVRRPTGGRAILHDNEITFSLYLPLPKETLNPLVLYCSLKEAWVKTLQKIGLFPDTKNNSKNYFASPYCFSLNTAHEITIRGKKIIGIAQAKAKKGVLFQGSFILSGNREEIACCFINCEKIQQELWSNLTTLEELTPKPPVKEEITNIFLNTLAATLEMPWYRGELSGEEQKRAEELFQTKYAPLSPYHTER
jgi:lipoate-protein ligase A